MFKSTQRRKEIIEALIREHYEPGRQDRCKRWVYLHYVYPLTKISERTFYRYLGEYEKRLMAEADSPYVQLSLF
jgi:hypothetical protein